MSSPDSLSSDSVAYLIELPQDGENPAEYVGARGSDTRWVTDPNKAIRFARREDAESVKAILLRYKIIFDQPYCPIRVTEHMWQTL